jgi:hypothetical protein
MARMGLAASNGDGEHSEKSGQASQRNDQTKQQPKSTRLSAPARRRLMARGNTRRSIESAPHESLL